MDKVFGRCSCFFALPNGHRSPECLLIIDHLAPFFFLLFLKAGAACVHLNSLMAHTHTHTHGCDREQLSRTGLRAHLFTFKIIINIIVSNRLNKGDTVTDSSHAQHAALSPFCSWNRCELFPCHQQQHHLSKSTLTRENLYRLYGRVLIGEVHKSIAGFE